MPINLVTLVHDDAVDSSGRIGEKGFHPDTPAHESEPGRFAQILSYTTYHYRFEKKISVVSYLMFEHISSCKFQPCARPLIPKLPFPAPSDRRRRPWTRGKIENSDIFD